MLVTLADMKTFLGIDPSDTTQDAFLTLQLQLVSDAVEEYCNRKFASASYTQTFYREDMVNRQTNSIPLFHFPLNSIATIVEKDLDADAGVPVIDYRFHKPSATLTKTFGKFFANGKILEVTYEAGYTTIPSLVLSVVYAVVQERYNKKINGIDLNFGSDVQRLSIPGTVSIDFDYSLSTNERKSHFGVILGNHLNALDAFRSERSVIGDVRLSYVS